MAAREFAEGDPYVRNGLISYWYIRDTDDDRYGDD